MALAPQLVKLMQDRTRHLERAPNPRRIWIGILYLYSQHAARFVSHHRVEELRPFDRKNKKRQSIIAQRAETVFGKPDRIRKSDQHDFIRLDERQRAKNRVTQSGGRTLYG